MVMYGMQYQRRLMMTDWTEFLESALEQFQQTVPDKIFVILNGIIVPIKLCEVEV